MNYYVHYMKDKKGEVHPFWRSRNNTLAKQEADYFKTMFGDKYTGYTKETK